MSDSRQYPFEDGIDHLLFHEPKPEEYGLDPDTVDAKEWQHAVDVVRVIAHKISEGLIAVEENEDGTLRLYPTT